MRKEERKTLPDNQKEEKSNKIRRKQKWQEKRGKDKQENRRKKREKA